VREAIRHDRSCAWSHRNRSPTPSSCTSELWLEAARQLGLQDKPESDLLLGRDVLARIGGRAPRGAAARWIGDVLRTARQAQEDGLFETIEAAQTWLDAHLVAEGHVPA